jgi:hypothetical protein
MTKRGQSYATEVEDYSHGVALPAEQRRRERPTLELQEGARTSDARRGTRQFVLWR